MIKIIEKEPYKSYDRWNERDCLMYPVFMIKDGKEYFVLNRRETNLDYNNKENQRRLEKLNQTNGKYTVFYGDFENPFEMLKDIIKKMDLIITNNDRTFEKAMPNEDSIDFHGNRQNYSSAFMYRIFDKELENDLKEVVNFINGKEWDKAEMELQEKMEKYKNFQMENEELEANEEIEQ